VRPGSPLTDFVVTKIVELAKAGERAPEILRSKVLAELETPAKGVTHLPLRRASRIRARFPPVWRPSGSTGQPLRFNARRTCVAHQ
jgi:hypothetical protein